MQVPVAVVVVQVHMAQPRGHRRDPVQRRRFAHAGIGMADIEAQAEARVIDARCDLHEHVRPRLHHVLHRHSAAAQTGPETELHLLGIAFFFHIQKYFMVVAVHSLIGLSVDI